MKEFINPFVERKRKNIQFILKVIKALEEKNGKVNYSQIIAYIVVETGLSEKTVRGDLKILKDANRIEIKDGFVKTIKPNDNNLSLS